MSFANAFAPPQGRSIKSVPVCFRPTDELLPLVYLDDELGYREESAVAVNSEPEDELNAVSTCDGADNAEHRDHASSVLNIVVLQADHCRFGLVVRSVRNTEEIVVKPLNRALSVIPQLAGSTIMGDGRVVLILDVPGLARSVGLNPDDAGATEQDRATDDAFVEHRESVLVCELRSGRRIAVPLTEVDRLEDYSASIVERANHQQVVQYRDCIMPLVNLSHVLQEPDSIVSSPSTYKTVVVSHHGHRAGLVVRSILDVVRIQGDVQPSAQAGAIVGSAVLEGRVTDIIDVAGVIQSAGVDFGELR